MSEIENELVQVDRIATFVAERAKQDPKVQRVVSEARMFGELRDHGAWKRLYDRINSDKQTFLADLAKRLMKGEKVGPEEIAFMRGFYLGASWVVSYPEKAEDNLRLAASVAWSMVLQEAETTKEVESPYVQHS